MQGATAAILLVAANTSFADFPRLTSLMARDCFLPRRFADLGDRLVYSNGIVLLTFFASLLVWAFGGDTSRLIPLYAVGGVPLGYPVAGRHGAALVSPRQGRAGSCSAAGGICPR